MTQRPANPAASSEPYRVLARKYRPTTFTELIGQQALVRTLTNAIAAGRVAQAFILTGVRGVGKTTTARIIARALNCVGPDGTGGPTADPCGLCDNCRAIADDRHVDVLEMDAASRTGVDDIRDLIDGVRYRPVAARFKVYIVDEVHMLSKNAFNALLKTLEEPPEHVKFVFATTEIRKVPVTVLSRCQRFDLRRVEQAVLAQHFAEIALQEGAEVAEEALHVIARAADGSVRDGLSLLDQAIAHCGGRVDGAAVRAMLGLADRAQVFDLLRAALSGDMATALAAVDEQRAAGADPSALMGDLLDAVHWLTRVKAVPAVADAPGVPEAERVIGREMATTLSMGDATRAWQLLLKGLGEVRMTPSPFQALEMVIIRLAYAARLPTPAEAVAMLTGEAPETPPVRPLSAPPITTGAAESARVQAEPRAAPAAGPVAEPAPAPSPEPAPDPPTAFAPPATLAEIAELAAERGDLILNANLVNHVHLIDMEPGRLAIRLADGAPSDVPKDLSALLSEATGTRWMVTVSRDGGAPTLRQQADQARAEHREAAAADPLVRAVLDTFPGAEITEIRPPSATDEDPEELEREPDDG